MADYFVEALHPELQQGLRMDRVLYHDKSDLQDLIIFENPRFGRVMCLDGVVQTTEGDECVYHEMLAHVPILAHGSVTSVLIIGGGDGGMAREALKHADIAVTMVEIDRAVVDFCAEHLPNHSAGAFEDPRLDLIITDGAKFVKETSKRFDVIIIDSTDPIGPGAVLFTAEFYADCKRCLTEGGVLVTQNGVPFVQPEEIQNSTQRLGESFADVHFYRAAVPTYQGGDMAFGWATDNADLRRIDVGTLTDRYAQAGLSLHYLTPDVHAASFALPKQILDLMAG